MAVPTGGSELSTSNTEINSGELQEFRLLTEVNHLRRAGNYSGEYSDEVLGAVLENLIAKVQEDAMSGAVSVSTQPIAIIRAENGEHRRTFLWRGLGKTALEVAMSGYGYHASSPAHKRVGIEVQEAGRNERALCPGIVQSFISPRMSPKDAPYEIAEMEHLADEDAVRTASAVLNAEGEVVALRRKSLLVRDIPLTAWIAMASDPNNMFGKAFDIKDKESALSIMQLFSQLDLPEEAIPEGPITIIANVIPYIEDPQARNSVERQLIKFRENQEELRLEAEATAREWLKFEKALAQSLDTAVMQPPIQQFVLLLQTKWSQETRALLKRHESSYGGYTMSTELAAHLEEAWQKVYLGEVALAIGDERALKDVDIYTTQQLQTNAKFIRSLQWLGYDPAVIADLRAQQLRSVAGLGVTPGGGCSGVNRFRFRGQSPTQGSEESALTLSGLTLEDSPPADQSEGIGEVTFDVCRTEGCPSRPIKTKVGGCRVCLKYCQPLWDQGKNPQIVYNKTQANQRLEEKVDTSQNKMSTWPTESVAYKSVQKVGGLVLSSI